MRVALGAGWGVLVFAMLVPRLRGAAARDRGLATRRPGGGGAASAGGPWVRLAALRTRPGWRVAARLGSRRREGRDGAVLRQGLVPTIDLLGVGVAAGLTPRLAIEAALPWAPQATSHLLGRVVARTRNGASLCQALEWASTAEPVFAPVAGVLEVCVRLGTPGAPALARLGSEMREAGRRSGEERARRVPVKLLFPLIFGVLPSFLLLTVVPVLLAGAGA